MCHVSENTLDTVWEKKDRNTRSTKELKKEDRNVRYAKELPQIERLRLTQTTDIKDPLLLSAKKHEMKKVNIQATHTHSL